MELQKEPTKDDIISSYNRIEKFIHRTPVHTSSSINDITGSNLFLKCENFQKVGAFKFRGATNALLSLSDREKQHGVATHSSGNHAAALSLAAKMNGTSAFIVMPKTAPKAKVNAVKYYGGQITFCEPTLEDREKTCTDIIDKTNANLIHPYNNYNIIAGASTCCFEIIEDIPDLDYIIAPVGGGGLLSGSALSAYHFGHNIKVIAAEPEGADDAYRSIRDGKIYPSINPKTIADGLLTSLCDKTYNIIKKYVDEIITVSDELIIQAMRMIWERMKIIVEPSAAVTLAVILKNKDQFRNKKTALILSGGNLDLEKLPWQL